MYINNTLVYRGLRPIIFFVFEVVMRVLFFRHQLCGDVAGSGSRKLQNQAHLLQRQAVQ
jgi:hypothetical protein